MTNNSPCGCGHDHEEEKDAPVAPEHACCGGGCHGCGDDSEEDACGCGHDHVHTPPSPEEIAELMKAIEDAGYKVEATPDGEIRILEK